MKSENFVISNTAVMDAGLPILETRELVKIYGGVKATDKLNIKIGAGELHSVIGPNGAGKSTFFKLLMGTEMPTSGSVLFNGADISALKPFERARLGLIIKFQNTPLYQDLTVTQNLFIPLRRHYSASQIPDQIEILLARVHLSGTENTIARSLSHGQQQWLSICAALAAKPKVLLLDEPAAGMSEEETHDTSRIIRELNSHGVTIVVIEHDMEFIRQLGGRVSVLNYGRLFAQGTMSEIENNDDVRDIYLGNSVREHESSAAPISLARSI